MSNFVGHEPCPKCGSKDNLGRYADGGAYCFGCGYVETATAGGKHSASAPRFVAKVAEHDLCTLEEECRDYLGYKYDLLPETLRMWGVKQVKDRQWLYLPVWNLRQRVRGAVIRRFDGTTPKALSYKHLDEPWLAWYPTPNLTPLIIVEDQLSAMRCVQMGLNAVALMGTTIGNTKWAEISTGCAGCDIILALDRDKFDKARQYARKYPLRLALLDDDLKDCTDGKIKERLGTG